MTPFPLTVGLPQLKQGPLAFFCCTIQTPKRIEVTKEQKETPEYKEELTDKEEDAGIDEVGDENVGRYGEQEVKKDDGYQGRKSLDLDREHLYFSSIQQCIEEDTEGGSEARKPGADQEVFYHRQKCAVGVVAVDEQEKCPKDAKGKDEEIDDNKVGFTQQVFDVPEAYNACEGVEREDGKQNAKEIQMDFPGSLPLFFCYFPVWHRFG